MSCEEIQTGEGMENTTKRDAHTDRKRERQNSMTEITLH